MPYAGNKRNECEDLYKRIEKHIKDDTVFIEPYCGSCAVSYYIWLKHPNLKFILNDGDKFLFEMYKLMKNETEINKLNEWYNKLMEEKITKERYKEIIKEDNFYGEYLKRKFYRLRPGMYPEVKGKICFTKKDIREYGIYNFFNNANIEYKCIDAVELIKQEKDKKNNIIFIDPPYINTYNKDYNYEGNGNIYEYCFKNNINKFNCVLFGILETNWIISLLFPNNIIYQYDKKYEQSKKKTTHLIIANKS
jgi:hypothetical protein